MNYEAKNWKTSKKVHVARGAEAKRRRIKSAYARLVASNKKLLATPELSERENRQRSRQADQLRHLRRLHHWLEA